MQTSLTRRDALTKTAAIIAGAALLPHEPGAALAAEPAPELDLLPDYLDHNIAYLVDHLDALTDPGLVAIDQEFLGVALGDITAAAQWDAWRDAYHALQDAIDADAPHLRPLLNRMGDAGGDLGVASEADSRDHGIALACALLPPRTDPLDITTWEAFQLFPLPGSVPDADATYAAVIARLRA